MGEQAKPAKPNRDYTVTKRQQARREKLNQVAKDKGFDSWSKLETAVIGGTVEIKRRKPIIAPNADADFGPAISSMTIRMINPDGSVSADPDGERKFIEARQRVGRKLERRYGRKPGKQG